ncbi:hypothetical protein NY2A_b041R [Paramecium bursaria Chlorella virus NY2A]|uniref:Uncharacterized protein b041R n=1 Tax=Paramecium bursaria Chlorella virus NY2A TaxID=46021 RepID=A7IVR6_PBCVN|nr:hypothetical protein NY2A_b041R [Paramecium bursaria Chlorella virus NY2A]ABT14440.1 hypothetical protein NY2A_b041R [Paramecium bursaria Chlorella virus NY2A]
MFHVPRFIVCDPVELQHVYATCPSADHISLFCVSLNANKLSNVVLYTPDKVLGIYIPFPGKNAIPIPICRVPDGNVNVAMFAPVEFPTIIGYVPPPAFCIILCK